MMQQRVLAIASILVSCLTVPVSSQIIPDGTTNTSIVNDCRSSCNITGGTVAKPNLFHSFQEFNVSTGEKVYFSDPGVTNIFGRITGSNPSEIFGTLGVADGDANLFLVNPNGIIFGEGASLDLNGTLFATTADEIQFGDRAFSANLEVEIPLLTVNPSALFFNQSGQNGSIILDGANLVVSPQQDLILLGKESNTPGISLKNSTISLSEGNIALGAVRDDAVVKINDNLQPQFLEDNSMGNIILTEGSKITVTNLNNVINKAINVNADNLEIRENSYISTSTSGSGNSADIEINARTSLKIEGEIDAFQRFIVENLTPGGNTNFTDSSLQTNTLGTGNAGDIRISTSSLAIDNGAAIISTTRNRGASGNILIDVASTISLKDSGLLTTSGTFSSGAVGEIEINTERLLVKPGGIITASTLGDGDAGNLNIHASDSVQIRETPVDSIIPTGIFTNTIFGNGEGGDLSIQTQKLVLQNGGQLSSSSGATTRNGLIPLGGKGGNISIVAAESVEVGGISRDLVFPSSILSETGTNNPAGNIAIETGNLLLDPFGLISTSSVGNGMGGDININARDLVELTGTGTRDAQQLFTRGLRGQIEISVTQTGLAAFTFLEGDGGDISINTSNLSIFDGGEISVNSLGQGAAGKLKIVADNVTLEDRGRLNGTTSSGRGGNIVLQVNDILRLNDNSAIDTNSLTFGDGGNIDITADFVIASRNSSISANALAFGNGGNINITATELFVTNDSNITADSQQGIDGTVNIRTSFDSDRYNYTKLSQKVIPAENLIVQSCGSNNTQGAFTYTGRGGLPTNPLEFQTGNTIIADFNLPSDLTNQNFEVERAIINPSPQDLVEAKAWKINSKGNVELVAASDPSSTASSYDRFTCPL